MFVQHGLFKFVDAFYTSHLAFSGRGTKTRYAYTKVRRHHIHAVFTVYASQWESKCDPLHEKARFYNCLTQRKRTEIS
ncbi:hypothetical protein B0T12DRAFT_409449 [Alternaria alternata]|nr:hypothetical protein B0T12DRAFT_409449 [Alternaria alternata]